MSRLSIGILAGLLSWPLVGAAAAQSVDQDVPQAVIGALPACEPNALSFAFDAENGAFHGMQHDGRLLVIRNLGDTACRITGRPTLTFIDGDGHPLAVHRASPPGMHPGPVVTPVGIAAGAEVTATLRWIAGDAFGAGNCVTARYVQLHAGDLDLGQQPLAARFCAARDQTATFDQTRLAPDPVLQAGDG